MAIKELTVYEALQERKILEKRLKDSQASVSSYNYINKVPYIGYATEYEQSISGMPRKDFGKKLKANYQSTSSLIKNLAAYNAAIIMQ